MRRAPRADVALAAAALLLALAGAAWVRGRDGPEAPRRHPWIVIGIDGATWTVIDRLWERGELPHLRALANRGSRAVLHTAYNASPVIWTTIATGRRPRDHGITDFVVATPQGDVPVSSALRKVPALWNMASRAHRRVAVYGWWATWPAEQVDGVVVSDRVLLDLPRRFSPADLAGEVEAAAEAARREPLGFDLSSEPERRDRLMSELFARSAAERWDLALVYFRSADVVSHSRWHAFEPASFPGEDPATLGPDDVTRVYGAIDRALGRLLSAAPRDANVLLVSDHGFRAAPDGRVQLSLDLDPILERLGYLVRNEGAVDFSRSLVYPYESPSHHAERRLRFALAGRELGGGVAPEARGEIRARLERDLERVRWAGGEPVFALRDAKPRDERAGADFVLRVLRPGATPELRLDGDVLPGRATVHRLTGTHTASTPGVLVAAGPDVRVGAELSEAHIHDLAPTILYGMGLPVADDFVGQPLTGLFQPRFAADHPRRGIASWGQQAAAAPATSPADAALVEELKALGYLD